MGPNEQEKSINSPACSYTFLSMSRKNTASVFVSPESAALLALSQPDIADRRMQSANKVTKVSYPRLEHRVPYKPYELHTTKIDIYAKRRGRLCEIK